jgi:hypothetical protein
LPHTFFRSSTSGDRKARQPEFEPKREIFSVTRDENRERLKRHTRLGIERGITTRWRLAVIAAAAALLASFWWPFHSGSIGFGEGFGFWSSGEITSVHSHFAEGISCQRCHASPFQRVQNRECLECHTGVKTHATEEQLNRLHEAARQGLENWQFETQLAKVNRCAACHIEHEGAAGLAEIESSVCAECHAVLQEGEHGVDIRRVSSFDADHPDFRFAFATNPAMETPNLVACNESRADCNGESVACTGALAECSGIAFNHLLHVGKEIPNAEGETVSLACGECHSLDGDGKRMRAVSFDRNCRSCHRLSFDPDHTEQAIHGDLKALRAQLKRFYAEQVLENPKLPPTLRRERPDVPIRPEDREFALRWVDTQARIAEDFLLAEPEEPSSKARSDGFTLAPKAGECGRCHHVIPTEDGSAREIAAVQPTVRWLPMAEFDHSKHETEKTPCRTCHAAAAVYDRATAPEWATGLYALTPIDESERASEHSTDILIPDRKVCLACHGGADAAPPLVASECVSCHIFHADASEIMGPLPDDDCIWRVEERCISDLATALWARLRGSP